MDDPIILALGNNGTTPQYVSAMASGNPYVLNLSPTNPIKGQLGLQIPGEDALVFDASGMSLYTGNCSTLTQVLVDNFYAQLGTMAERSSRSRAAAVIHERQSSSPTTFIVEVAVDAYLNTPSFSPNLTFGDSKCTIQLNKMGSTTDNVTWACPYPPTTGGAYSCETNLGSWLDDMSAPSTTPGNTTQVLATISPFLALASDSILTLFPGSDPALAVGFTFMQQAEKAAKQAIGHVGPAACQVLHVFDSDDLVMEDTGPLGTQTLGSYMTAPPPSLAINLAATATAAFVNVPRRKVNPKDNFLIQIATNFSSIFGAFTLWLGGLGSHPTLGVPSIGGIGGFQETRSILLTNPAITLTSSTTTATPSAVHATPTMTVTHVLGDGWFNPSTFTVGPDTSTGPHAIEFSTADLASQSSGIDAISLEAYNFVSSTSDPTYASSTMVDHVLAQLATMGSSGDDAQTDRRWANSDASSPEITSTTIDSLGIERHVVVITTTLTFLNGDMPD